MTPRQKKSAILLTSLLALGALAYFAASQFGLTMVTQEGDTHVYSFQSWIPIFVIMGCATLAWAGWLWSKADETGGILVVAAIGLLVLIVPTFYINEIVVDRNGFAVRDGIWGHIQKNIQFSDLQSIRLIWDEEYSASGRYGNGRWITVYFLRCEKTDGTVTEVRVGNPLTRTAFGHVLETATKLDIPVSVPYGKDIERWYEQG